MFGTLRLILAMLVMAGHLWGAILLGVYAVFSFFVISGYLMCLVTNERYGFTVRGFRSYALNRFLRIYPPYWAAILIAVLLTLVMGEPTATALWRGWSIPDVRGWLANASLLGIGVYPLVPPAWALRVEVIYYVAIGLVLGRGPRIALLWLAAGIGYHVYVSVAGLAFSERYFPILAGSLPFSIGAVVYHTRARILSALSAPGAWLCLSMALWLGNIILVFAMGRPTWAVPYYMNCVLTGTSTLLLTAHYSVTPRLRRLDSRLGDLCYPVYLIHMQVGFAVATLFTLATPPPPAPRLLFVAAPFVLIVAWVLLRIVDDPVEHLRTRVKQALKGQPVVPGAAREGGDGPRAP
jgi:peptidoglycan/LPS O-acetylase OafA/YrhL